MAPGLPCYVTAESICLVYDLGGFHVLKELLLAGHCFGIWQDSSWNNYELK